MAGGFGFLGVTELFYSIAIPALVAFGWFAARPKRPSIGFAAVALWAAFSAAAAGFPLSFSDGRHNVGCPGDPTGIHSVWGFSSMPWWWWHNAAWEVVVLGPAALVELTYWHILDPLPEC